MKADGLAALRCWPIRVELGSRAFTIAPQPALAWVIPIIDQDWLGIVPGMIDSDDSDVDEMLSNLEISVDDCVDAARDAVSTASGMSWWAATRLVMSACEMPDLAGELVICRVDAEVVSLGAFTQTIYRILVRDADKKQRGKIDSELGRPPAGVGANRYDPEVAADLFEQMASSRGLSS